jgi:hypothetical protein
MVQTLTVWSSGTAEINTGTNFLLCDGLPFSDALQTKLNAIEAAISIAGISQLHVEKDTFRQFEHAVKGGEVSDLQFGSTVSVADFDWIMQHVDVEMAAQAMEGGQEPSE